MKSIVTKDGSNTLYSQKYKQHFHNTNDGALAESLHKHVIPALTHHERKKELHILDICFGLGYNTFATLYWLQKNATCKKLFIYSPELDRELVNSLKNFSYPKEFEFLKPVIQALATKGFYQDENLYISLFFGDAREYISALHVKMDIVYQDAFSAEANKELWTKEYFQAIKACMQQDAILTTYAVATPVRLALHVNGFYLQEHKTEHTKKGTLGFLKPIKNPIDMELKQKRNPQATALCD